MQFIKDFFKKHGLMQGVWADKMYISNEQISRKLNPKNKGNFTKPELIVLKMKAEEFKVELEEFIQQLGVEINKK